MEVHKIEDKRRLVRLYILSAVVIVIATIIYKSSFEEIFFENIEFCKSYKEVVKEKNPGNAEFLYELPEILLYNGIDRDP